MNKAELNEEIKQIESESDFYGGFTSIRREGAKERYIKHLEALLRETQQYMLGLEFHHPHLGNQELCIRIRAALGDDVFIGVDLAAAGTKDKMFVDGHQVTDQKPEEDHNA